MYSGCKGLILKAPFGQFESYLGVTARRYAATF
jgi:hypothetical protein